MELSATFHSTFSSELGICVLSRGRNFDLKKNVTEFRPLFD